MWTCHSQHIITWSILLIVPKGVLLSYGALLAFKVRNVEQNFNESKYLGTAITNIINLLILLIPTLFIPLSSSQAIVVLGVLLATINIVGAIFAPKIYNICVSEEWKLGEKNTFITASENESASSRPQINHRHGSAQGAGAHGGCNCGARYTGSPPASLILRSSPRKDQCKPAPLSTHLEDPQRERGSVSETGQVVQQDMDIVPSERKESLDSRSTEGSQRQHQRQQQRQKYSPPQQSQQQPQQQQQSLQQFQHTNLRPSSVEPVTTVFAVLTGNVRPRDLSTTLDFDRSGVELGSTSLDGFGESTQDGLGGSRSPPDGLGESTQDEVIVPVEGLCDSHTNFVSKKRNEKIIYNENDVNNDSLPA